jgi:uncharacterized protein (DUF608 family)
MHAPAQRRGSNAMRVDMYVLHTLQVKLIRRAIVDCKLTLKNDPKKWHLKNMESKYGRKKWLKKMAEKNGLYEFSSDTWAPERGTFHLTTYVCIS